MGTKLKTVSVRLDDHAGTQVSKAAQLARQSKGSFLAKAGIAAAEQVLLDWATQRHAAGEASLSELAYDTGIAVEALEQHVSAQRSEETTGMYLTSARRIAEVMDDPGFYADAKRAADAARKQAPSP